MFPQRQGQFYPGVKSQCDVPLIYIYKLVLQLLKEVVVYYMNMDITHSQEYKSKCVSVRIYILEGFPQF